MKNGKAVLKWINVIAFTFLVLGGLNFLFMGLFGFDMYAAIFGGVHSVVNRILYSLFGLSAVTLLGIVLYKAFKKPDAKSEPAPRAKPEAPAAVRVSESAN